MAIFSSKNQYKFDQDRYKSDIFRISYDFDGNYDDYGHSRVTFGSIVWRSIEPTFGSISTALIIC